MNLLEWVVVHLDLNININLFFSFIHQTLEVIKVAMVATCKIYMITDSAHLKIEMLYIDIKTLQAHVCVWWLALSPHTKKDTSSNPRVVLVLLCVVCLLSLQELWLPPTF